MRTTKQVANKKRGVYTSPLSNRNKMMMGLHIILILFCSGTSIWVLFFSYDKKNAIGMSGAIILQFFLVFIVDRIMKYLKRRNGMIRRTTK